MHQEGQYFAQLINIELRLGRIVLFLVCLVGFFAVVVASLKSVFCLIAKYLASPFHTAAWARTHVLRKSLKVSPRFLTASHIACQVIDLT